MIAASSGPIRVASSRAGMTTLIDCNGVSVGRTGGATAAAFTSLVIATVPAPTRSPIEAVRTIVRNALIV